MTDKEIQNKYLDNMIAFNEKQPEYAEYCIECEKRIKKQAKAENLTFEEYHLKVNKEIREICEAIRNNDR
jgi:hypothetical protein